MGRDVPNGLAKEGNFSHKIVSCRESGKTMRSIWNICKISEDNEGTWQEGEP